MGRGEVWFWSESDTLEALSFVTAHCYEMAYKRIVTANDNGFTWSEFVRRYRLIQRCNSGV